ncbi:glycosyl transferase family protein [Streptococcus pneumoniae]|nr:glycosyl transferase family protein [Streptococcus pneumoniae]
MFYFHISGDSYYEKVYDNVSIFENLYETQEMRSFALISAWGKLYKARLFEQLRFDMGKLGEDGYLNQKVYLLSEKVIYLNKSLYAYRIRKGSLSRIWTEKWMHALVDAMSERITLLANMGYPLEKHLAIYRQMLEFSLSNGQASGLSDTATYKEFEMKKNQLTVQESSEKKAIVLAANYAYVDQVLTTIKSICYHNRSLRFYLIHSDFPNEWIKQLNKRLEKFDSEIINCRVTSEQISCYKSDISYTVFLRYFIADFVQEDKALYLDCDLVVTKNLDDLFATDLQDYPLAAVRDFGGRAYFGQEIFNAGVLLVNNAFWKKENMTQKLIDLTNEWHDKVDQADQSILNMLFEHKWLELDFDYNHIVIHKQFADYQLPEGQDYPAIIHYLSHRKPWKDLAAQTYREVWWYYHGLEWTELGQNHHLHPLQRSHIYPIKEPFTCLIYTASDHIEQIETLVQSLPDIQFKIAARVIVSDQIEELDYLLESLSNICFHIAAPVQFSEKIRSLETNYNVRLRTITNEEELNFLVDTCDFLLDINHFQEVDAIVSKFVQAGKSVFAFDNTVHGNQGKEVFLSSTPDKLVSRVRDYLNEVRLGTNHQEKIIQDGTWNVFKIDDKAHFIVGANVACRNFENFHVSSGKVILHDGVFINNSCSFNCMERIEIGAGTMMGEGVRFYDHDHIYTAEKIEKWQWTTEPIRVGRDCWIGSNVTILKGVTIGDNTIHYWSRLSHTQ